MISAAAAAGGSFVSCAPCRLCLFGEHQDYLGLPVIALSLPLFCRIRVDPQPASRVIVLHVPALDKTTHYNLDDLPAPRQQHPKSPDHPSFPNDDDDVALAAIHEALQDGWSFPHGATCVSTIDDNLPLQAGCSTSSAFAVAWIQALARLARQPQTKTALELAQCAHRAEVTHFGKPGGTMDHVTAAVGGIVRIGPDPWDCRVLSWGNARSRGVWILADSGEPKDTLRHLWRCKNARLALLQKLDHDWDNSCSETTLLALSDDEQLLLQATRVNRDTEALAYQKWMTNISSAAELTGNDDAASGTGVGRDLGALMMEHHCALRDGLQLSTPKLEAMNAAAMNAGAWGFKVVGSGGGGCGVAWSSEEAATHVLNAMKHAGAAKGWIIRAPSNGAHILTDCDS